MNHEKIENSQAGKGDYMMDNSAISEDTREKIEEAVVSVFMDQYAAVMNGGIDAKIDESADLEFPPELDKRCRALIQREYAKQKKKSSRKGLLRVCRSAAVVAAVLLSLCSVLFMTVEAFRLPVINFFIEKTDRYWQLSGVPNTNSLPDVFNPEDPLDGIIPGEFDLISLNGSWEDDSLTADYSNGECSKINFAVSSSAENVQIDTEDSLTTSCKVLGHEALKSAEGDFVRITWMDEENSKIFTLCAINVSMEMVEIYAEDVAMRLD